MLYADMLSSGVVSAGSTSPDADIAIDAEGRASVAYVREGEIVLRSYDTGSLAGSFRETVMPDSRNARWPRLAKNNDGDVVVVWTQQRDQSNIYEVYYYTEGGDPPAAGEPPGSGVFVSHGKASLEPSPYDISINIQHRQPVVDIDGEGNFAVAWQRFYAGSGPFGPVVPGPNILGRVFDASAETWVSGSYTFWSDPHPAGLSQASDPAIDVTEAGRFALVWMTENAESRVLLVTPAEGVSLPEAYRTENYQADRFGTTRPFDRLPDVAIQADQSVVVTSLSDAAGAGAIAGWERFTAGGSEVAAIGTTAAERVQAVAGDVGFSVAVTAASAGAGSTVSMTNFEPAGAASFTVEVASAPGSQAAETAARIDRKGSRQAVLWVDEGGSGELVARVYGVRVRPTIDLNGDRLSDGIWENSVTNTLVGTLADTSGGDAGTRFLGGDSDWTIAAAGDFDGDGVTDLVWRQRSTGLSVLRLLGQDGSTTSAKVIGYSREWGLEASGDYDGNGMTDLVWRHHVSGVNVMWLMEGENVRDQTVIGGGADWRLVATDHDFDVNADGTTDLIWRQASTGANVVKRMQGSTELSATVLPGGDSDWEIAATGDYDGDGSSDVLWRQASTGSVVQWRLVDAVFQQATWMGGSLDWSVVGSEDADGDGSSDVLWRQVSTGVTVLRRADGSSRVLGGDPEWSFLRRPGRVVG